MGGSCSSNSKKARSVRKWSPEEDALMRKLVAEHGTKHWGVIGQKLQGRSGKQCRERSVSREEDEEGAGLLT